MPFTQTYYFGKLHLLVSGIDSKGEFLISALKAGLEHVERTYAWGFFNSRVIDLSNRKFLFGHLVKYTPLLEEEIVDIQARKTDFAQISDRVVAKSPFFLDLQTEVLAYHPVANKIGLEQFRRLFAQLLKNQVQQGLLIDAEVTPIVDETPLFDAIDRFDTINQLSIWLIPSNPVRRDLWGAIDHELKELNARKKERTVFSTYSGRFENFTKRCCTSRYPDGS